MTPDHPVLPAFALHPGRRRDLLLVCDHASNAIPPELGTLGLDDDALGQHVAIDIGAAGITQALPMTLDAVRAAAPNYVVAQVQQQVEGEPFTAITLSAGDEVVFQINPTADGAHIHSITTDSTQARGPLGEIVGRSVFDAPEEETEFCASEQVQGAAGFACSTAADGRFWRVYRLPADYDGPSDPFDAIDPDVLHAATLAEMRWVAPRV